MTIRQLLGRFVIAAAALASQGLYCQGGPDCSDACDVVRECPNLNKNFLLSCSRLGPSCLNNQIARCSECVTESSTDCDALAQGKCDPVCDPDFDAGTNGDPDAGQTDGGSETDAGL